MTAADEPDPVGALGLSWGSEFDRATRCHAIVASSPHGVAARLVVKLSPRHTPPDVLAALVALALDGMDPDVADLLVGVHLAADEPDPEQAGVVRHLRPVPIKEES